MDRIISGGSMYKVQMIMCEIQESGINSADNSFQYGILISLLLTASTWKGDLQNYVGPFAR